MLAEGELTEAMLAATGDALVKVIRTSTQAPQKVPQSVDVIPHMTPIFEDLKVEYEKDMPLLQNPEAATGAQTRRTCAAAIDVQSRVLALPPPHAARVLRYLASSAK